MTHKYLYFWVFSFASMCTLLFLSLLFLVLECVFATYRSSLSLLRYQGAWLDRTGSKRSYLEGLHQTTFQLELDWTKGRWGREGEHKRKEKRSRVCSWQLFQQPVSLAVFSFLRYHFDESVPIFNLMWEITVVWQEKRRKQASVLFLFLFWFLSFPPPFFFLHSTFFSRTQSSRSFHSPFYWQHPSPPSPFFLPSKELTTWYPPHSPKHQKLAAILFVSVCLGSSVTTA